MSDLPKSGGNSKSKQFQLKRSSTKVKATLAFNKSKYYFFNNLSYIAKTHLPTKQRAAGRRKQLNLRQRTEKKRNSKPQHDKQT